VIEIYNNLSDVLKQYDTNTPEITIFTTKFNNSGIVVSNNSLYIY
jgi:hypothetical protein